MQLNKRRNVASRHAPSTAMRVGAAFLTLLSLCPMTSYASSQSREELVRRVVEELKAARLHIQSLEAQAKVDAAALAAARDAITTATELTDIQKQRLEVAEARAKLTDEALTLARAEAQRLQEELIRVRAERDSARRQRNWLAAITGILVIVGVAAASRD